MKFKLYSKIYLCLLLGIVNLSSCFVTSNTTTADFAALNSGDELNGTYINRNPEKDNNLLDLFNTYNTHTDLVNIKIENRDKIRLSFHTDSAYQEITFPGKMKKKYFEIYFSKTRICIPPVYFNYRVDRIRIGKTRDGNLLIRNYENYSGAILLLLAAGSSDEKAFIFYDTEEYGHLVPTLKNGLWGYTDSQGIWIIPAKYYKITPIDTLGKGRFLVSISGKKGVINEEGEELIPPLYDYIENPAQEKITIVHIGDKQGFILGKCTVVPVIYSKVYPFKEGYAVAKRNGTHYMVDGEGYEYDVSEGLAGWILKPETKRKIQTYPDEY